MTDSRPDFSDLIGRPFMFSGRGPANYDCYGLLIETYWRWHGVKLPDYPSSADDGQNAVVMARESAKLWRPLERPEPGAALLMSIGGVGCHVGMAISSTRFIHVIEGQSVMIERIHRRFRIIGAYLYVGHQNG